MPKTEQTKAGKGAKQMSKTRENQTEDAKIGVYICHCGGNISDHVDVEKVAAAVRNIEGVAVSHTI